jgi:hypothetical protein
MSACEGICPLVHLCFHEDCQEKKVCQNREYWKREHDRKVEKSTKEGRRRRQMGIYAEAYKHVPHCMKNDEGVCDKQQACGVLNECLVRIPRIAANERVMEHLRGPRNLKEIINLLRDHDPEPMRSYYFRSPYYPPKS